jgi:hypothetical protein
MEENKNNLAYKNVQNISLWPFSRREAGQRIRLCSEWMWFASWAMAHSPSGLAKSVDFLRK